MLSLLFTGIVAIIIISAFIIVINNRPDFWFWLFLNLYFDPGGYVDGYFGGNVLGLLNMTDVFIAGIVICLISARINWKTVYSDQYFTKFLLALLIFSLYYFIVYGGIVPYFHNDFDYPTFLLKNRIYAYGIIILIAVYAFSLRSLKYFYSITLFIGVICLSLYLITLLSGIPLIPVWEFQREGTEMMRKSMHSYGIFYLIFPLSLIVFILSRKININLKHKLWLYYGGMVMIITLLITLTRRTQIDIIGTAIIIVLIISYLFRTGKITGMFQLLIPAFIVMTVLYFTLPDYPEYIRRTGEETFLLFTTGRDSRGETEARVSGTGDLEITKEYIRNNLFFGTGYTYLYWGPGYASSPRGPVYSRAADAAGEVPIYYLIFGFGIVGAVLMLPLYIIIGKLCFYLAKLLKLSLINFLHDPLTIIISIYVLLIIGIMFTIKLYALSSEFIAPQMSSTALLLGLGLSLYRKLNINLFQK